eukprot:g2638.t1
MSGLGLLVTASERAGSGSMDNSGNTNACGGGSPRGSKRPVEDTSAAMTEETCGGGKSTAGAAAEKKERGGEEGMGGGGQNNHGQEDMGQAEGEGDLAATRGDLEFCQRTEGLNFTTRAMDGAAAGGHLAMVKWLHEKGFGCTTAAMDSAAQDGHLEVVQWLHESRSEGCSDAALAMAAGRGHMSTVEWFYGNSVPGDISKAIDEAQAGGHAEVVDWLKSHSSKKSRIDAKPAAGSTAAAAAAPSAATGTSPSTFQRQQHPSGGNPQQMVPPPAPGAKACPPMGMFGSPFGNFSPVNGIVLPGPAVQAIVPKQAAAGVISSSGPSSSASSSSTKPSSSAGAGHGGGSQRLRSNMLRSPELTLATSGRLSTADERQLKAVMEFRKAYSAQALEGSNIPKDPFTLFAVWFEEARIARASEPGAMCLSTVGPTGRPSARYVMLQGFDKRGFVWYTNFESRKSQEMSHNPYGALSFWWSEVQRAVRIEGVVCKVTEKESTEYFQSRPRGSQVGAWALHQSRPVESRGSLEANVKDVQNKFSSIRDVPRPPHFGGFRLRPDRIEFWKGRQTRIHDRIVYVIMDDKWIMQRLQP